MMWLTDVALPESNGTGDHPQIRSCDRTCIVMPKNDFSMVGYREPRSTDTRDALLRVDRHKKKLAQGCRIGDTFIMRFLVFLILLLMSACTTDAWPNLPSPPASDSPDTAGEWVAISAGAQALQAADGLVAVRHWPLRVRYEARFESQPNRSRSVGVWLSDNESAVAAVNCGFYLQEESLYRHIGLLMADGKILQPLRTGWGSVLIIRRGGTHITRRPRQLQGPGRLGIQGWPTLLWNGRPVAGLDASTVDRRTAVGIDGEGRGVWVVNPRSLSLDAFAQRLLEPDLAMLHAINLDGGVSSGLRWRMPQSGKQLGVNNLPTPCALLMFEEAGN